MNRKKRIVAVIIIIFMLVSVGILTNRYYENYTETWRDSDIRFNKSYSKEGVRVACIGDSITQGGKVEEEMKDSYPYVLGDKLSKEFNDFYIVENFGLYGAYATKESGRPYLGSNAHEYSLSFNPDIVIIMLGTNDSQYLTWNEEEYTKDYSELIESYIKLESKPRVVIATPIPAFSESFGIQPEVVSGEIFEAVEMLGEKYNLQVIDVHGHFANKSEYYISDNIHLNSEGKSELATLIFDSIDW